MCTTGFLHFLQSFEQNGYEVIVVSDSPFDGEGNVLVRAVFYIPLDRKGNTFDQVRFWKDLENGPLQKPLREINQACESGDIWIEDPKGFLIHQVVPKLFKRYVQHFR